MANWRHVALLHEGPSAVTNWHRAHPGERLDLRDATLTEVELNGADLRGDDFGGAILRGAILNDVLLDGAYLGGTDLIGASLSGASLVGANLARAHATNAKLRNADLREVDLSRVVLRDSDLTGSDLRGADLTLAEVLNTTLANTGVGDTVFAGSDLSVAIGLETVEHRWPSHIAISTLRASRGGIPDAFLRGCGLSDWEILGAKQYAPNLAADELIALHDKMTAARLGRPQTRPLFISYSHGDALAVDKVEDALQTAGVRVWRDIHDAVAGPLEDEVHKAMTESVVVVVLSEASLRSDWVEHEVEHARRLEKEQKRHVLCPIALDASWTESKWPTRLMEQVKKYSILDFARWQDPDAFAEIFRRLEAGIRKWY